MRYLSYAVYPLIGGYAIYALMYQTHKSWWVGGQGWRRTAAPAPCLQRVCVRALSLSPSLFQREGCVGVVCNARVDAAAQHKHFQCSLPSLVPPPRYSWVLNSLVGAVYAFGFILM